MGPAWRLLSQAPLAGLPEQATPCTQPLTRARPRSSPPRAWLEAAGLGTSGSRNLVLHVMLPKESGPHPRGGLVLYLPEPLAHPPVGSGAPLYPQPPALPVCTFWLTLELGSAPCMPLPRSGRGCRPVVHFTGVRLQGPGNEPKCPLSVRAPLPPSTHIHSPSPVTVPREAEPHTGSPCMSIWAKRWQHGLQALAPVLASSWIPAEPLGFC